MKKSVQIIYIVLFLAVISIGTIVNFPNLYTAFKETVSKEKYELWATSIGWDYNDNFSNKYFFVNANGFIRNTLGQRTMKDVVKTSSGKLVIPLGDVEVFAQAENTYIFHEWLKTQDIPFAYIQVPYEICKYDSQLPYGITDYSNANADTYLALLEQNNVPYLDLRESMHTDGMTHYDAFFQTDHHWRIETAFWAYGEIVDYIEPILDVEIPNQYTSIDSYYVELTDAPVLGSSGRKTGISYGGLDTLSLIYPKYNVQASFEAPEEGILRTGTFQEAYMVYERLEGDSLYEMSQYNVYIGEDYPTTRQKCETAPCDKKILIIKDSFSRPVQAFLGTSFSRVDTIDLRYYDGNIQEYILEYNPDIVLLCYNPYMLHSPDFFHFIKEQ